MKLKVDNCWAYADGTVDELAWLDEYVSCEDPRAERQARMQRARWAYSPINTTFRMFDKKDRKIPAGLAYVVEKGGRGVTPPVDVEIEHTMPPPYRADWSADIGWIRTPKHSYQYDAVRAIIDRGGRGLVKVPTGGGKTEIFIAATKVLPCEWFFVVHRASIVRQTAKRYMLRTGERAGIIEDGIWKPGTSNVTVGTFQSVSAGLANKTKSIEQFIKRVQAVNVDESHAQPADTFYNVTMRLENAYYRTGMSGTPFHKSEREKLLTLGALGPIIYKIKTRDLINRGVLSDAKIRMVKCVQAGDSMASWREIYKGLVSESIVRNNVVADIVMAARKPCMVFVDLVKQGDMLEAELLARGVRVDFTKAQGEWSALREAKIDNLARPDGELDVLITTKINQEGIDVPTLKSVVNAGGMSSHVSAIQRMGRGMRTCADGDDTFEMWDVLDLGQKWLARHAGERKQAYESEGFDVEVLG